MKNKEWLKAQIKDEAVDLKYAFDNYVPYEKVLIADDVNDLLNQLEEPEQEKVVVPQFVADWIEEMKNGNDSSLRDVYEDYFKRGYSDDVDEYLDNNNNFETFARAWLNGYTVEKEKLYRVELIRGKYLIYNHKNNQLHNQELDAYVGDYEQREFTEQEIKAIDERYLAFKVEVTK